MGTIPSTHCPTLNPTTPTSLLRRDTTYGTTAQILLGGLSFTVLDLLILLVVLVSIELDNLETFLLLWFSSQSVIFCMKDLKPFLYFFSLFIYFHLFNFGGLHL